jgi:hypothetical protein
MACTLHWGQFLYLLGTTGLILSFLASLRLKIAMMICIGGSKFTTCVGVFLVDNCHDEVY